MKVDVKRNYDVVDVREGFRVEDYSFTVDWLNVRLDCDNIELLITRLVGHLPELDYADFVERDKGINYYEDGIRLAQLGYSSFVIAFNRDLEGNIINTKRNGTYGVHISVSGDGCRYINSLHKNAFIDFLKAISVFNPVCTRIDVACDIFDKDNMLVPMIQTFADTAYDRENAKIDFNCGLQRGFHDKDGNFIYRQWVDCRLVYDRIVENFTRNVTIGGRDCKKGTLQLYNKRVEVENGRLSDISTEIFDSLGVTDYWWRLEYRCKSFAQKVYDVLYETGSVYNAFLEAAQFMGTFVMPVDTKITRALLCIEWQAFLKFVEKMCTKMNISPNSGECVNLNYIASILPRIDVYHHDNISANDAIHWLRMCIDDEYRKRHFSKMLQQIVFNDKLKPALDELRQEYGLKLNETVELYWQQVSCF